MKIIKSYMLLLTPFALCGMFLLPTGAEEAGKKQRKEPHLALDVSAALIDAVTQRLVDRTEPVEETIQETPVRGMGRTVGLVRAELVPDPDRAVLDFVLQGTSWSQTIGARRTVRIHTFTTTSLDVRHRVVLDGAGIRLFAGPQCAESTTELLNICSVMDFDALSIQMAKRLYQNYQRAAEAETACKTAAKASHRLQDELTPKLGDVTQAVGRELTAFKRGGLHLDVMDFNTTVLNLQARLRFITHGQDEPSPLPTLPSNVDLGLRLHESMVNEAAQASLAGRSFLLSGASKLHFEVTRGLILDGRKDADKQLGLKNMEKILADLAGKPVEITLAEKAPVLVTFANQGFNVEVRVGSIRQDKVAYAGLRVRADYRFKNTMDGVEAERKRPIQIVVEPANPDKKLAGLPDGFLVAQEVLFGEVFTERLILAPLPLPEALARLDLAPPQAYARSGWFALTWKLRAK